MDPIRFDGLARSLAGNATRRNTLAGLLAGVTVPLLGEAATDARKGRNKRRRHRDADAKRDRPGNQVDAEKKKKKKCKAPTTKCGKKCFNLQADAANCDACGNVCPGYGLPSADATCNSGTCNFTCRGDSYDVDGNPANGCEVFDSGGAHTQSLATRLPDRTCSESGVTPPRPLYSAQRIHSPQPFPAGVFDLSTGAAPQWWVVKGTGGFVCDNDLNVTLNVSSGTRNCYRLMVRTGINMWEEQANAGGVATISRGAGAYTDNADIFLGVTKTCSASIREAATYTISYEL